METWNEFKDIFNRVKLKVGWVLVILNDGSSYQADSYQILGMKIYLFLNGRIIGDVQLSDVQSVE